LFESSRFGSFLDCTADLPQKINPISRGAHTRRR
jgi:hypothetical protein